MNHPTEEIAEAEAIARQEHEIKVDGVIDLPSDTDPDAFFDGLLDAIIEHVEKHKALAGLGMTHLQFLSLHKVHPRNF